MSRFVLAPLARRDLEEIRDYIARDSASAARRVVRELRARMLLLAERPGLGRRHEFLSQQDLRVAVVYSYLIVFRPDRRLLEIARVLHGARDIEQAVAEQ